MIFKTLGGASGKPEVTFDRIKHVLGEYPNLVLLLLDGFDDVSVRYQEEGATRSLSNSRPSAPLLYSGALEPPIPASEPVLNGSNTSTTPQPAGSGAGSSSVSSHRARSVSAGSESGETKHHLSRVVAVVDAAMRLPNGVVTCRTDAIPKTWIGTGKLRSIYEVVGFTEGNVCDYIKEVFRGWGHPALGARLLEQVRSNPELMQLAQIPVNLAALCLVTVDEATARASFVPSGSSEASLAFSSEFVGGTLSTTCLYHRLILGLARRYVVEHKASAETRQSMPYLEDDVLLDVCAAEFHLLGEVAMDALLSDELQALSPTLLCRHFRSASELRTVVGYMGIIRRMGGGSRASGDKYATHYFIHPTYREYFTAFRMAQILSSPRSEDEASEAKRQLDIQTVTKFIMENHPRSHMIRIFLAGLLCTPRFHAGIELFWDACIDISSALSHSSSFGFHAHTNILTSHQRVLREALLTYQAYYEAAGTGGALPLPPRLRAYERRFHQIAQWMEAFQTKCIIQDVDYVSRSRSLIGAQAQHEAMKKQHEYDRRMFGLSPAPALDLHLLLAPLASWQASLEHTRRRAQDTEIDARISVAEAIGHCALRDTESVAILLALLRDTCWEVRRAAAKATGKVRVTSEAVVAQLRGMLVDNYAVRIAAAEALGSCGVRDASSISALLGALEDTDWCVRTAAAEALGHVGGVSDKHFLASKLRSLLADPSEYVRKAAVTSIQSLKIDDDDTIRSLRKLLKDSQKRVQVQAAEALETFKKGDNATTTLTASSHSNIINKLTKVGLKDVNALPQLRNLALRDPDKAMRCAASEALARVGARDPGTLYALRMELRSPDYHVRVAACEAMGRIGACDSASLRALRETLRDRRCEVYVAAAQTLKHLAAHLDAATLSEILEMCFSSFAWESKRLEINSELHLTLLFTPPLVYAATFSLFPNWLTSDDALLCFLSSLWLHCTSTTVLPDVAQLVVDGKDVTLGGTSDELRTFVDHLRVAEGRFLKNLGNHSAEMKFIAAGLRQPIELPRTTNTKIGRLIV
jgi:HEAT repeat protein